jgi:hypothetical protein
MKRALGSAVVAGATVLAQAAGASVIWDGDASRGTGVFKSLSSAGNCGTGSVTAVSDPVHGRIWRYHKPAGSNRCENHGIAVNGSGYAFRNNTLYYIGWRNRLSTAANNNANFQWKSYGNHIQNWPVVLKMVNGRLTMLQRQPGNQVSTIWSRPVSANTWNTYVLALRLSDQTRGGYIEFWFNGVKQTFSNGSQRYACRLFDGGHVCPKWGIYGGSGTAMTNFVDALRVGTTYADVAPR